VSITVRQTHCQADSSPSTALMADMAQILKPRSVPLHLCVLRVEVVLQVGFSAQFHISTQHVYSRPATSTAGTSQDMLHRLPPALGYKRMYARFSLLAVTSVTQQRALHASAQSHPACGERADCHCSPLPGAARHTVLHAAEQDRCDGCRAKATTLFHVAWVRREKCNAAWMEAHASGFLQLYMNPE